MPYTNQIPDSIISANQYYQSKDSFQVEDQVNTGSELKSIIVDQSNFRFSASEILPNSYSTISETSTLELIDQLSTNVLQVSVSNMFPKLATVNSAYGPISDINMETTDHDGYEFTVKYAVDPNYLSEFRAQLIDYTSYRDDTATVYKYNSIPNLYCRLEYTALDPAAKTNKGTGGKLEFHSCFILNLALSTLSYEGNDLAEVTVTFNANRIT
jgi:hypothetical protein